MKRSKNSSREGKDAGAYIRVSDESQLDGHSLDAQRAEIERWCESKGFQLVKVYVEEGKSAHTDRMDRRPKLMALLQDANAGQFEAGRHHVLQVNRRVDFSIAGDTGTDGNERHTDAMIVKVLLAEQTVMADGQTMIGGEKNVGVVSQRRFVECVENAADLRVHVRDDRVVFLPMHFDGMFRPREGAQFLVAESPTATNSVLEGILRLEVDR